MFRTQRVTSFIAQQENQESRLRRDKIDSRKRDECAPTCCGRSNEFWDSGPACQAPCLRVIQHDDVLGGRHFNPKCPIILHGGNFPRRRTLESFNAIQWLLQPRHEGGRFTYKTLRRSHLSCIVIPGISERVSAGGVATTRLASVNVAVFLSAAGETWWISLLPTFLLL